MKHIDQKLIPLLKNGYCAPKIASIAQKLKEPSTTIHFNLKKLEKEGKIKAYKAVFDYRKIDEGFCAFVLLKLLPSEYKDPEKISMQLAKYDEVESVDIITGDWELILKVRVKDQDAYYHFIKNVLSREGIGKTTTLTSLKQIKSEFVAY
ncbi:Lrp/AsnC family transcriptional regulator [Candidatus Woesearchaeota archaeon]|nr:Lrp/AsnC family transcriptional regulator [Candidatus Woesearchaeota archaeon]